jgi:uncharacterized membrane protein YhaH (DUF805 family)
MSNFWSITFKGELIKGFEEEAVMASFMETFSVSDKDAAKVFNGAMHTLGENISQMDAQYNLSQFNKIGMYVHIQPMPEYNPNAPVRSGWLTVGADGQLTHAAPKVQMLKTPYATADAEGESKRIREKASIPPYFSLNFGGRYGRLNFCNAMALYMILPVLGGLYLILFAQGNISVFAATVAVTVISALPAFRAVVLRLHDMEHSVIWAFIYLLLYALQCTVFFYYVLYPEVMEQQVLVTAGYLSVLFYFVLLFVKGSDGKNTYGSEVKRGMLTGAVILAGLAIFGVYLYPYW